MWTQRASLSWLLVPLGATARNHRVMNLVLRLCKAAVTAAIPLLAPSRQGLAFATGFTGPRLAPRLPSPPAFDSF